MLKYAIYTTPTGAKGDSLYRATREAVKWFGERLIKEGYNLLSTPSIRKIRHTSTSPLREGTGVKGSTLLIANSTEMSREHPWFEEGKDQYEIGFRVAERRPRQVTLDISEDYIKRRGLPKGFALVE